MVKPRSDEEISKVPEHLIYEELNGLPVYYRGYKLVLNKEKTLEEIMGYGSLQWVIINILTHYLNTLLGESFWVLGGEGGLHIDQRNNLSIDLGIFPRQSFSLKDLEPKYFSIPPKVVIEVDTKADPEIFQVSNYYPPKTQSLLDFGVEQVIWLFTDSEKVMVAEPGKPWITVNWTDEIHVLNHPLIIQQLIDDAENAQPDQ